MFLCLLSRTWIKTPPVVIQFPWVVTERLQGVVSNLHVLEVMELAGIVKNVVVWACVSSTDTYWVVVYLNGKQVDPRMLSKRSVHLWSSAGTRTAFSPQSLSSLTATAWQQTGEGGIRPCAHPLLLKCLSSPGTRSDPAAPHSLLLLLHHSSTGLPTISDTSQHTTFQVLTALVVWFQRWPVWLRRS